jgi:hypothetical protein
VHGSRRLDCDETSTKPDELAVVLQLLKVNGRNDSRSAQEELPMKRSLKQCTTAFAAAALLGLPAAGWSQATEKPTTQQPTAQQPAAQHSEHGTPQEHLTKAKAALDDVQTASVPASAKAKITELKRHVSLLEKSAASETSAASKKPTDKATWSKHVAEIDKILTELVGPTTSATPPSPGATGTTGSRAGGTAAIDEPTKSKLMEVRTHITAFAASMSGAGAKSPGVPEASPDPAAAAASATPAQPDPASNQQATPSSSAPQSAASSSPTAEPSSTAPTTGSSAAQAPTTQAPSTTEPAQSQQSTPASGANEEEAKQHLTAARNALSELTQLPAAAQLTGEARTQVSQLITNFNELITTKTEWRASYEKVDANIAALLGPESASAPADPAQPQTQPQAGTAGAVGTTGAASVNLDPAIKAKLVEVKAHLDKFEKAAGAGESSPSASSGGPAASTAAGAEPGSSMDQEAAMRHIEAIEAIVSGGAAPSSGEAGSPTGTPGAAGTTGSPSGSASGITLDRTKVEQIRMHLAELRKVIQH